MSFVAWISLGTQAAISTGQISFLAKPVSVEECPEEFKAIVNSHNSSIVLENAARFVIRYMIFEVLRSEENPNPYLYILMFD